MTDKQRDKLENFERAFSGHSSGCRRTCECGIVYFDGVQSYDWEDGELEKLMKASNSLEGKARFLDYAPSDIVFEGRTYVDACECWHERAAKIMNFIDGHAHAIAAYLTLEKKRKQQIADAAPVVGEISETEGGT